MNGTACTRMTGVHLLDGAGHWVQQEQAKKSFRQADCAVSEFRGAGGHRDGEPTWRRPVKTLIG
jgi:hypothetical protein